ncbi:CHOLESTEROL OXIDASE [Salix purpurea]|uniref:Cholesterol oxidase n=1 Tax=Salix purpurea TaxID=77065 RepID=A0A9Q0Q1Q6_SALPP|nr:CHOLESTEROL OXIDASE [Salix purpurea]
MGEIAEGEFEESIESSVKLSVKFDAEEPPSNPPKLEQTSSCFACGNCLAGCPYNAKNSTDKNYLISAIQAGCTIRTKCQARYVVKNPHGTCQPDGISSKRRWRVYINEIDFITSDWVILSAGVLGTTEILFQSQMRGLRLPDTLGSGFSCNGNTLAYVAGSAAPVNGYGLNRKQLSEIPYQDRPGPSISSSHTSSLGFTIQSAILPRAYPYMLFEGITTYTWPTGHRFFQGIVDRLKRFLGLRLSQSIILNAMGYDESDGKIMLDKDTDKICFHPPQDPLLPRKIIAFQKLTKKLGGILFMSRYRSTAVHLLGGCNASSDSSGGVCNHKGQVFDPKTPAAVHSGLYVCDASLIPCSVGINPSLTIATAAEHASRYLVQDILEYKNKINPGAAAGDQNQFSVTGEPHPLLRGKAGGYVVFRAVEKEKLHIIDGEMDLCVVDCRTPYTQYMRYRLLLAAASGSRYILEGKKIMNPCHFLHCTLGGRQQLCIHSYGLTSYKYREGTRENFTVTDSYDKSYPSSTVDDIRTADGFIIRCRHWRNPSLLNRDDLLSPILLLNGYTMESYWLPTEPQDLVRTLLDEGHEVWLLQTRLHPLNPANNATIEDIGKYDIPAAIGKILEVHGPSTKIHVVAHCAGGLAIHIALMGGHVSATHIASLSCTNSSMFFKLTAVATIKMWLPLVPVSMAILGEKKILPLMEKSKGSSRHRLLKFIARCLPRYERCSCKECEVLSGIFGNAFWHENVSPSLHQWLITQSATNLPMSAFPHLRRICNSRYIVDSNGNSSFLIHPERMAISTLYISGGRSLLVTPETSFLANKYMKLHQPGFRHERVVVDGFGHSDLLIGEKSHEKVFPHIISHIRSAEQEGNDSTPRKKYSKEALDWADDPDREYRDFGSWFFALAIIFFLLLLHALLV